MGLYDIEDRLNWEQASRILGVSKSAFFRLVSSGFIPAYGRRDRCRFYLRSDCRKYLEQFRVKK